MENKVLLEVTELRKCFPLKKSLTGKVQEELIAVDNVSFTLNVYGSANLQQKVKCMNLLNDLL